MTNFSISDFPPRLSLSISLAEISERDKEDLIRRFLRGWAEDYFHDEVPDARRRRIVTLFKELSEDINSTLDRMSEGPY